MSSINLHQHPQQQPQHQQQHRHLHGNMPYLKKELSALLQNTSPVITLICSITLIGYLLSFSEIAVKHLTVTPGYILPNTEFWIWTAFTFCFIELHWWEVVVDVITVGLCGKMIEPLWGQMEMFKFFAVCNIGVSILTTIYYLFNYMFTKDPQILFDVHIHGLAGYVAGFSVAVHQIMPDHLIFNTRFGKITNRNVPLIVLLLSILFWLLNVLDGTYPAMFASGLLVSWIYLRFYQHHPNGSGDSSECFAFASFFPRPLQRIIGFLINPIYICCLKVNVIKPPAPSRVSLVSNLSTAFLSMSGVDTRDVERRRQIALKALSERLKSTDVSKYSQLPRSFPAVAQHAPHHSPHQHQHYPHQHHPHHHRHQHQHQHHDFNYASPQGSFHTHGMPGEMQQRSIHDNHIFNAKDTTPIKPVVSARAEPRMISTMSPIAIPMPAPPVKGLSEATLPVEEPAVGGPSSSSPSAQIIDIEGNAN